MQYEDLQFPAPVVGECAGSVTKHKGHMLCVAVKVLQETFRWLQRLCVRLHCFFGRLSQVCGFMRGGSVLSSDDEEKPHMPWLSGGFIE